MTLPSADNDLLILTPSLSRSPVEPLLSDLSEPASKFILFTVSVIWRLQTVVVCLIHELMQRRYAKTRTPNFCKVLRQHRPYWRYGCMTWILLEIYCSFQQWKDVENPLRIDSCRHEFGVLLFLVHSVLPTLPWQNMRSPHRPLLAVPNVTAHPSTASVRTSYYSMWHYNCLWRLNG